MQVARMLDPAPRTYVDQVYRNVQVAATGVAATGQRMNRRDTSLTWFLTDRNIQGVKAASLLYFSKTPDQLSLADR
jgi:membrane carboxypeptidase/penicillin-binding protein PbpC